MGQKQPKARAPPLNILKIPIYSMELYDKFVFLGGGGGYEIANKIQVFELPDKTGLLTKMVHEESTDKSVCNFMQSAKDGSNIMIACLTEQVTLYTIEANGKLTQILKLQSDFSKKDACLNQCMLSYDQTLLVTGGDDTIVRVHFLNKLQPTRCVDLEAAQQAVTGVDINKDNTRVIATSKDAHAYIFDLKSKTLLDKLSFRCRPDTKNMIMRACAFTDDGSIFTLCTQAREPTFVIKWRNQDSQFKYQSQVASQVHEKSSTGMRLSKSGTLGILTSDGFCNLVSQRTLKPIVKPKKLHNMPITSCAFRGDQEIVTASTDFTYKFSRVSEFNIMLSMKALGLQFVTLFVVMLLLIDYIY